LYEFLGCRLPQLNSAIKKNLNSETKKNEIDVEEYLRKFDLFLSFGNLKRHIDFDYISNEAATSLYVRNGYKRIDVDQFYYIRYNISLAHPELPCLVQKLGNRTLYYPLELVTMEPRQEEMDSETSDEEEDDETENPGFNNQANHSVEHGTIHL
jgi:hypothetical protein